MKIIDDMMRYFYSSGLWPHINSQVDTIYLELHVVSRLRAAMLISTCEFTPHRYSEEYSRFHHSENMKHHKSLFNHFVFMVQGLMSTHLRYEDNYKYIQYKAKRRHIKPSGLNICKNYCMILSKRLLYYTPCGRSDIAPFR